MAFFDRHMGSTFALASGLLALEVLVLRRGGAVFSKAARRSW